MEGCRTELWKDRKVSGNCREDVWLSCPDSARRHWDQFELVLVIETSPSLLVLESELHLKGVPGPGSRNVMYVSQECDCNPDLSQLHPRLLACTEGASLAHSIPDPVPKMRHTLLGDSHTPLAELLP